MSNTNLATLASLLSSVLPTAEMPRAAMVAVKLWNFDQRLIALSVEEDECGIDHTLEIEQTYESAFALMTSLGAVDLVLHWNDELPKDAAGSYVGGRLRVVSRSVPGAVDRSYYMATPADAERNHQNRETV